MTRPAKIATLGALYSLLCLLGLLLGWAKTRVEVELKKLVDPSTTPPPAPPVSP